MSRISAFATSRKKLTAILGFALVRSAAPARAAYYFAFVPEAEITSLISIASSRARCEAGNLDRLWRRQEQVLIGEGFRRRSAS
jgi:hypothetical protein